MKQTLALVLAFSVTFAGSFGGTLASASSTATPVAQYYNDWTVSFTPEQLENLLAPIALYPDPLLAQVLLAATFPDQIDEAARALRAYGTGYNIDLAAWDVSVKAVAHYPTVLSMMADKLDWTTALGQAYVNQSTEVMEAVQRLRRQARSAGYLVTTPQQEIVESGGYIYIYPAQARYIYVPVYDPAIVFVYRPGVRVSSVIWFGVGLLIGAWLNHDCDWGRHRVFYHGWQRGPVWIQRSRPHIRVTNIYVNNNYRNVIINRNVLNRNVNYRALDRYNRVHRNVNYDNVRRQRDETRARREQPPVETRRDNEMIRRNIDPRDPRIDANRGRVREVPRQPEARRPEAPRQPEARRPEPQARQPETRRPPETRQPEVRRPEAPRAPEARRPEQPRPAQQPRAQQPQSVFRRGSAEPIDSRSASQRGHESRQQQKTPPKTRPAPAEGKGKPPKAQDRGQERRHQ